MTKTIMLALINEGGHINKKQFDGDRRTKTHSNSKEDKKLNLVSCFDFIFIIDLELSQLRKKS